VQGRFPSLTFAHSQVFFLTVSKNNALVGGGQTTATHRPFFWLSHLFFFTVSGCINLIMTEFLCGLYWLKTDS
jgi:hypothetical protein